MARQQEPQPLRRRSDIIGLIALLVSVLFCLALWAPGNAGAFGEFVNYYIRMAIGYTGLIFPIMVVVFVSIVLVDKYYEIGPQLATGWLVMWLSLTGFIHLFTGQPNRYAPVELLHNSGGILGAAITQPLIRWFAFPGTIVVLLGLFGLGVMMVTSTPFSVVGSLIKRGAIGVAKFIQRIIRAIGARRQADRELERMIIAERKAVQQVALASESSRYDNEAVEDDNPDRDYEEDFKAESSVDSLRSRRQSPALIALEKKNEHSINPNDPAWVDETRHIPSSGGGVGAFASGILDRLRGKRTAVFGDAKAQPPSRSLDPQQQDASYGDRSLPSGRTRRSPRRDQRSVDYDASSYELSDSEASDFNEGTRVDSRAANRRSARREQPNLDYELSDYELSDYDLSDFDDATRVDNRAANRRSARRELPAQTQTNTDDYLEDYDGLPASRRGSTGSRVLDYVTRGSSIIEDDLDEQEQADDYTISPRVRIRPQIGRSNPMLGRSKFRERTAVENILAAELRGSASEEPDSFFVDELEYDPAYYDEQELRAQRRKPQTLSPDDNAVEQSLNADSSQARRRPPGALTRKPRGSRPTVQLIDDDEDYLDDDELLQPQPGRQARRSQEGQAQASQSQRRAGDPLRQTRQFGEPSQARRAPQDDLDDLDFDDSFGEEAPSTARTPQTQTPTSGPSEQIADVDPEFAELVQLEEEEDTGSLARKLVHQEVDEYQLPPLELLQRGHAAPGNHESLERMRDSLEAMLAEFRVDASVVAVRRGPTVTRFEIELGTGVKVNSIIKLDKDIAYSLATPDVRIVAPIPGKVAIGIEVPNEDRDHITLGDILVSEEALSHPHPLAAALGLDIGGRPVMVNLAKMPHLLIAGATGSGKSVVMNGIVTSLIMRNTPEEVRMILIDPKRVEMAVYEDIPHLLTQVVTDAKRAKDALDWLVSEMERRYDLLAATGVRNLDGYNAKVSDEDFLPFIVCIIDELADLMMVAKNDVESAIVRIAQMARAVGIHLVIATQRPSVNVVTGLIKANVPSRIALSMATGVDSKTIIDQPGAEKLIGMGDMLYLPANVSKPHRLQGCYVDEGEIEQIVDFVKAQAPVVYEDGIIKEGQEAALADIRTEDVTDDDLTRAAMELVVRSGLGSTSMLQRKLKIGFARAGRVMDELESMGIVGPSEGPKARNVLMTVEELESRM